MRIQSSLTEESLYRDSRSHGGRGADGRGAPRGGRFRQGRSPMRRVFRLGVLLVLVLFLMREAANPQVYRNFFAALGAPLDPGPEFESTNRRQPEAGGNSLLAAGGQQVGDEELQPAQPNANGDAKTTPLEEVPTLKRTAAQLDPDSLERMAAWLFEIRESQQANEALAPLPTELRPVLDSAAVDGEEVDGNLLWDRLAAPERNPDWIEAWSRAVDQAMLNSVSDATIWEAGDRLAFYRLLEAGSAGDFRSYGEQAVRVGYASLADQSLVYRGKPVFLEGSVARVERVNAEPNPFEVDEYWLVWLRPDDGSERPVMAYATEIPSEVQSLADAKGIEQGPAVRTFGVYLRRHLYRSVKGTETAPVIVGQVELIASLRQTQSRAEDTATGAPNSIAFWIVGFAIVFAVGVTLWVTVVTSKSSRWQREMRQRGSKAQIDFLADENQASARPSQADSQE